MAGLRAVLSPRCTPGDPDEPGLSLHLQHEDERLYGWISVDRSDGETYAYSLGVYADFERQPNCPGSLPCGGVPRRSGWKCAKLNGVRMVHHPSEKGDRHEYR